MAHEQPDRPGDPSETVTCSWCGAVAAADQPEALLTWTTSVEAGQTRRYCATCSREHVRGIESKLDSAWW